MASFDAVFVGSGINSLAGAALLSQRGWRVCVLEREDRLGGCLYTSDDLTLPGFTHEVLASWHPLWTGGGAYAELKDELDREGRRVRQHRPPHRHRLSRRLGGVHPRVSGRERRRAGLARRRRRRRVGVVLQRVHGQRGPRLRPARHRAVVERGSRSRADGLATLRSARAARVRRRHARLVPRLGDAAHSGPRRPTGCWRHGCCTPGSGPIRRPPAS